LTCADTAVAVPRGGPVTVTVTAPVVVTRGLFFGAVRLALPYPNEYRASADTFADGDFAVATIECAPELFGTLTVIRAVVVLVDWAICVVVHVAAPSIL
jgi:hypothetical protein